DHIRSVIANGNEVTFRYIINWMAWGVQNPGKPAQVAIVLCGAEGTGKGVLARAYSEIFKPHIFMTSALRHVAGDFNKSLMTSLFVFLDEAEVSQKYRDSFYSLITEDTISLRAMHRDAITVPNRLKIMMTSNHDFVVPAGENCRRFVVCDVSSHYTE